MKICKHIISLLILIISMSASAFADRLKDLTSLAGVRSNQLVGYGVVVGLAGTGDGNTGITLQSMQSLVSRFGVTSEVEGLNGDNSAAVMITADLPPFTKPGQAIDVTVSTIGGAESLKGGTLLMAPQGLDVLFSKDRGFIFSMILCMVLIEIASPFFF